MGEWTVGLPALLKGRDSGGGAPSPIPGGQWERGIVFLVTGEGLEKWISVL